MDAARWERIKSVFQEAFDRDPAGRAACLDAACGDDADLRDAVQRLLDGHAGAGTFLETPLLASPVTVPADPLVGRIVGPYRVDARIGTGGMGEVYRAHDARLDRAVALKLLPAAVAADPDRLRRFHAEARAASSLNHPHILVIHDSGDVDGRPFIVTELVEGETLRARLRAGPLAVRDGLALAVQVASALSAAHARGLVHRDVKPENVMIRSDGYVKLLDFGLAKLAEGRAPAEPALHTMTGVTLGTPRYMSPEQALGRPVDVRSDVFSCGALLYEMVTGRAAFEGATTAAIFDAVLHHSPPPANAVNPSVPAALASVIDKSLAKEPAARYQDGGQLFGDLNRLRSDTAAAAAPHRAARRLLWPAVAAVTVLAAFAFWSVLNGRRDAASPPPADGATRLVVLPFENLTGQSDDDWLAGGFSDSLTFGLQNVGDLVLVNRERISELYRSESVREAGALDAQVVKRLAGQLAVGYYVHGSYQRVGDTIRVVSRLVDARSGEIKAQESVTDRFANVLQVEDELARRFAASFAAVVAPQRATPAPRSLEAYQALTEARGLYANNQPAQAIPYLERAVALDPQYAEAWALLGKSYARTTSQATFAASSVEAAHNAAMKAAERAVALAPEFYDAHTALALVSRETGRLADWRREARRAIELAPRVAEPHLLLADSYSAPPNYGCSRDRDPTIAAEFYRRAIAVDPRDASAYNNAAYHFHWREQIDDAIRIADEGFARFPDNPLMRRRQVLNLVLGGRPDEAEAAFPRYAAGRELAPSDRLLLGSIRAALNRSADAAAMFDDGIRAAPLSANALWAARFMAQHGNADLAVTYLQRAVSMEPECAAFIEQAPIFKSLQAHPGVRALVTESTSAAPVRLVVLPFENLTGNAADDWLAGAFSDSLTSGLQDLDNVVLVSRDRLVELYRQERLKESAAIDAGALGRVARALAVRQVVHGSYQRVGGDIKVTARLIEAGAGAILAQESVTAPSAELLRVEDDLAGRFAARLHGRKQALAKRVETASLEAYQAFIDGRTLYAEGRFLDALAPLTRATTLDPNYAHAWAVLAKVHARRAAISTIASGDANALRRDALAAAQRAAALRPALYDAHAALALAFREMEKLEGWRAAARKAIDLNPRIAEAYELLADSHFAGNAWGCRRDRNPQMAEENFRRAIALDPRLAPAHANFSYHYSWLGREADALGTADEGLAVLPGNPIVTRARALALIRLKRLEEAEGALRNMLAAGATVSGQDHLMFGMIALARHNLALARREFDTAIARLPTSAFYLAVARAFFDNSHIAEGAAALDRAIALEPACAAFVMQATVFKPVQAHPAVRALVTRR